MLAILAIVFMISIILNFLVWFFFDDGFGGTHWQIIYAMIVVQRVIGFVFALNVLTNMSIEVHV